MKWFGSALIFCGGFWWWRLCLSERRRVETTLEQLLAALYQLREGIRMMRMPLPQLLEQAAKDELFFGEVLQELQKHEELEKAWEQAAEALPLPSQSRKVWSWLGGRLTGDEQSVLQAMAYVEQIMGQESRQMAAEKREANRRTTAICFSTAALVVILLL